MVLGLQSLHLSGDGIHVERPHCRSTYRWELFQEVTETPELILVWIDRAAGLILPKRDLPDGLSGSEAADLIFHVLVGLKSAGVPVEDVFAQLRRRFGVSGIDEKASRSQPR